MLLDIPIELFQLIIRSIDDRQTCHSLLLVSRHVHNETEPIFYETIHFVDHQGTSLTLRLKELYERLTASHYRLSRCVKRLIVELHFSLFPAEAQDYLDRILRQLVNLATFSFDYGVFMGGPVDLPSLYNNKIPFALKRFTWDYDFSDIQPFNPFLNSQQSLERLDLPKHRLPLLLSPKALPRLRILDAEPAIAAGILPGRHVTHFRSRYINEFHARPTAEGLSDIRVFCGHASYGYESILVLASLMHRLEYLALHTTSREPFNGLLRNMHCLKSTRVRYLRLTGYYSCSEVPAVALQCFSALPTLHCIDFQPIADVVCERWYRHVKQRPISIRWPLGWDWVCDWETGYEIV